MNSSLEPYIPDVGNPWSRQTAGHLLRRSGFQPSMSEVDQALEHGLEATIDNCFVDNISQRHQELDELGETIARRNDVEALRAWWLLRLTHTARPLAARMALFWHDHFATSFAKVQDASMMLGQLRLFERHGLGSFRTLLLGIARDPAMIVWLDGNDNINGRANENFARELFELFALGVGNYTEHDIQQAARAFTGWHQKNGRFRFANSLHDRGSKTVFGVTANFDGEQVIDQTLQQPACAQFLAGRLCEMLLGPETAHPVVDGLALRLRENEYDIGDAVRTVLASRVMFDEKNYRSRIKSPVEFVVGMVRSLELNVPGPALARLTSQMGQRLFEPPSVKGWDGHRAWLNTATMLVRMNAAQRACRNELFDAADHCETHEIKTPAQAIAHAAQLTLDGNLDDVERRSCQALNGQPADVLRQALHLLITSPTYQMA